MSNAKHESTNGRGKKRAKIASSEATYPGGELEYTGRYLVLFHKGAVEEGIQMLQQQVGISMVRASEFSMSAVPAETVEDGSFVLETLGVAVVQAAPEQMQMMATLGPSPIKAIEPEKVVYLLDQTRDVSTFLQGYQAAVANLVEELVPTNGSHAQDTAAAVDESQLTWGLQATNVPTSRYSGKGVRVAILDTGLDFGHPDFAGRNIKSESFIAGQTADDGHGHGTHCTGTACGPKAPGQLPRYGIAYEADIYIGKVLSNSGSGSQGSVLAGMEWAIVNQCDIVSMSLGAPTQVGDTFSPVYEDAAKRGLDAGTLIIAASGNSSNRPGTIRPVGSPANCPSIIAVGAIDVNLQIARFSDGAVNNSDGGQLDIVGPGVAVHSAWPQPTLYRTISGTSMATPHVAGIAALYAQANPAMRGGSLGWLLMQSALRLPLPTTDVGAGLVQAPQ